MRTIFEEHGIDLEILGESQLYGIAYKLRQNADRNEGFADLRVQNSRKPAKETREQTLAARVEQLKHELAYTRREVEFLKNSYGRFGGAEIMGIQAAPEIKFALIREAALRDNNFLKIGKMCEIAGVSRSGYYSWCASEGSRKAREDADKKDFDLILEAYRFRGYDKGAKSIHMRLLHDPGIIMNVKKYVG